MSALAISRCAFRATVILVCCACLQACRAGPPAYNSDEDDAAIYADVAAAARQAFSIDGRMSVHTYLAVARGGDGLPQQDLTAFEYEPSAALDLLVRRDTMLVFCQSNAQGVCHGNYVVFSQIMRVGERDAFVIAHSIRGPASTKRLLVKLRYLGSRWTVTDYEA